MPGVSIRGHFLWHELMTTDTQAAAAFYTRVIGWETQKWDQDASYTLFTYKGVPMAGLMSLLPDARATGTPPSWMIYIGVPDVHVTAWEAQRLGAKLHKGPTVTPSVGTWAILQDPQGAAFALYTPERIPDINAKPGLGDFSWHELATTDSRAAFSFYHDLFGWEKTDSMDMGPAGLYQMYGFGKRTLGGIYTKGKDVPGSPHWLAYVKVADTKKTTELLKQARGKVLSGPMEVPGGDWITMGLDPQGAAFAVHSVAPKGAKTAPKKPRKAKKAKAVRHKVTERTAKARKGKQIRRK